MNAPSITRAALQPEGIVDALERRGWRVHVLFLTWGFFAADRSKPDAIRGPWGREPFESLVKVVVENGFPAVDRLRAAIESKDKFTALELVRDAFSYAPRTEVDAALRHHKAALELAYGRGVDAPSQHH